MSTQGRQREAGRGFTLIELLLALGLFTVSVAMVACLFPAAIFQAKTADEHTMASIISQNAMATIRARMSNARLMNNSPDPNLARSAAVGQTFEILDSNATDAVHAGVDLDPNDTLYGAPLGLRQFGWVGLVRRASAAANDYQFVIVPYAVARGQTPTLVQVPLRVVSVQADMTWADPNGVTIPVGSPVILSGNPPGKFAYVTGTTVDTSGNPRVILSGTLDLAVGTILNNVDVWFLQVPGALAADKSPALGCVTFRTSLRP